MTAVRSRLTAFSAALVLVAAAGGSALAQKQYDAGASDTEIRIGNIMPYSGPASAYGVIGKTEEAYFRMINAEGGINGRKIKFISRDDAYSPAKAVEQARKLVESDGVLLVFNPLGTSSNTATRKYFNAAKVPQLLVASGASKWNDSGNFPWTMGWQPGYRNEAHIYAKYLMQEKPGARVAVLYQNDDFGKDYLKGLQDGFGERATMVVAEESYETSEPNIDAHVDKPGRRRRHRHQHHHAEIRGAGDHENSCARLEAAADRRQCFGLGRRRHEAGRLRNRARDSLGRLRQGRRRSAVGQ
jgi:branched-chain amino acid transport system substrate-binding protein